MYLRTSICRCGYNCQTNGEEQTNLLSREAKGISGTRSKNDEDGQELGLRLPNQLNKWLYWRPVATVKPMV